MDPEDKIPEIPYYTPERTGDPPGISFYTLQIPLYTKDERREDKGDNIANDDEYEDKPGMSFDSKNYLVVCKIQLVNKILSTNHLLSIFINYLLKELASMIITIVNPFCSPFLKGVLECKNNLIFRS